MVERNKRDLETVIERRNDETVIDGITDERTLGNDFYIGKEIEGQKGKYIIKEYLSKGGEAVVYLCEKDDTEYVIKIYDNRSYQMNTLQRKRFVEFLTNTRSGAIVPLLDYGNIDLGYIRNAQYDIYPYLKQGNISQFSKNIDYIARIVVPEINEALKEVHASKIIHRDIKPQNILISDDKKHVMLNDFSIMSLPGADGIAVTRNDNLTYGYAAPEVFGGAPHKKSDYYAFGITLLTLLLGKEVYDEYDEAQIRKCTMFSNIPYLDRNKFIGIETLTLEERIEGLICGLTISDANDRWGYEEVAKWIKGEISYPEGQEETNLTTVIGDVFSWNGKQCRTYLEMMEVLALDWERSIKETQRGTFYGWMRARNPEKASRMQDVEESTDWSKEETSNVGFFRFLYTIGPNEKRVYWKGRRYDNPSELVETLINEETDNSIVELLKSGSLSWFYKNNENLKNKKEIKLIEDIETHSTTNDKEAYQMFLQLFRKEEATFRVENKEIKKLEELIDYMIDNPINQLGEWIREKIFLNPEVYGWMWEEGYAEIYKLLKEDVESIAETNVTKRFLKLIEKIDDNAVEKCKKLVKIKGEHAHLYWLKDHINDYTYITEDSRQLKRRIEALDISENVGAEKLYENLERMKEEYDRFCKRVYKNPFDIAYDVYDNFGQEDVFPNSLKGTFVSENNGLLVASDMTHKIGRDCSQEIERLNKESMNKVRCNFKKMQEDYFVLENNYKKHSIKNCGSLFARGITSFLIMFILLIVLIVLMVSNGLSFISVIGAILFFISLVYPCVNIVEEIIKGTITFKENKSVKNKIVAYKNDLDEWGKKVKEKEKRIVKNYREGNFKDNDLVPNLIPQKYTTILFKKQKEREEILDDIKKMNKKYGFFMMTLMNLSGMGSLWLVSLTCISISNKILPENVLICLGLFLTISLILSVGWAVTLYFLPGTKYIYYLCFGVLPLLIIILALVVVGVVFAIASLGTIIVTAVVGTGGVILAALSGVILVVFLILILVFMLGGIGGS